MAQKGELLPPIYFPVHALFSGRERRAQEEIKGGTVKWSKVLNYSCEALSGCLCLLHQFVWEEEVEEEVEEEEESLHSPCTHSSENQSGCSVAALFRIDPCLFIWKRPRFFNFPPSPLFDLSWGELWNCNLRTFKHAHLFWPLVHAITLLLWDKHCQFGSIQCFHPLVRCMWRVRLRNEAWN